MNPEMKSQNPSNNHKGLGMYFSPEIAEQFAGLEQNESNFKAAQIVDLVLVQESATMKAPIFAAELGGGAHPDRYHEFFNKLLQQPRGHIDWVDVAPPMLELAKKYISNEKYRNRNEIITFIEKDILEYLRGLENEKLDFAIMKYTVDYLENLEELFKLLSAKLMPGGKLIALIGSTSPELKSYSTNARYLYNGEQFPDNETRTLEDGDNFTVKFFKVSGDPTAGYLEGAETLKYFHSAEKIKQVAEDFGFAFFLGDWKDFVSQENQKGETKDLNVLVLTKKQFDCNNDGLQGGKIIMNMNKIEILKKVCYTELVYGRINKKLNIDFSKKEIEEFIFKILKETEEKFYSKIGKNYYVENFENKIRITINSNTFRIITVDKRGVKKP